MLRKIFKAKLILAALIVVLSNFAILATASAQYYPKNHPIWGCVNSYCSECWFFCERCYLPALEICEPAR